LLILIPWSAFWERNYFFEWSPLLSGFMTNSYTRGAISGLGLINVWGALAELADLFGSGNHPPPHRQSDINPHSEISNQQ
jgi:hypothetical protein